MKELLKQAFPALLTLATNAIAAFLNPLLQQATVKRHAEFVAKVFKIADPIVVSNLGKVSQSDLYKLVRIAVTTTADGQLSPAEIEIITNFVFDNWNVFKANENLRPAEKDPITLKAEVDAAIDSFKSKQLAAGVKPYVTNADFLTGTKPAGIGKEG